MSPSTDPADPFVTAHELARAIRRRRISAAEAVSETLERIARCNGLLNAYLAVFDAPARRAAARADRLLRSRGAGGEAGPLHGVPVSVKDLIVTTEGPTTAGSRIFGDGLTAAKDAEVVRWLRRAGAIVIGKTNLHEVALGVTTVNEHFGPARNPWDARRMSGGSSGGSAAALAAGLGPLSVGTDTRGSIRIPAACCGVTGLKPTRGLVSLEGVVPLSPTLDHAGPMARTALDCALMLGVMAGGSDPLRYLRSAQRRASGLRIGVSEFHLRDLSREVQRVIEAALREVSREGGRLRSVRVAELDDAQAASVRITAPEAFAWHERHIRERPEAYGPRVLGRLAAGREWSAVDYLRAQESRTRVTGAFAETFRAVDLLVGAALPVPAPAIDETTVRAGGREEGIVDAFTRLNSPQNMAGVPALVMPAGFTPSGLPVGLQVIGPAGQDGRVLAFGAAWQRATDWHLRRPPMD
ncbi:MAG TPA: amidase [Gemmatimonadaceae bacterium]|nr:amidase [Gemmatimonadaceae bacterium]